jgi:transposase
MIAITPNTRVMVAIKPQDFRKGIDGLSQICRSVLSSDPKDGAIYVFRCRNGKSIKLLAHDRQGFWLAQKRLDAGRFRYWPTSPTDTASATLFADEFLTLICAGNRKFGYANAPLWWHKVDPERPATVAMDTGREAEAPTTSTALPSSASTFSSAAL